MALKDLFQALDPAERDYDIERMEAEERNVSTRVNVKTVWYLDQLGEKLGLSRSEVLRQLVQEAVSEAVDFFKLPTLLEAYEQIEAFEAATRKSDPKATKFYSENKITKITARGRFRATVDGDVPTDELLPGEVGEMLVQEVTA